ncbi:MAG: alpha/beta hydrolase [Myxococcota bacterium]
MPLDPQLRPLVDAMAANPDAKAIQEQTPKEARDGYRALASMFGPVPDVAAVEDRTLPGPAREVPIRVYRPEGSGPFGVLVFYHGGGWMIGDLDTHDRECRLLCNGAGCLVVSVDYRLAPEHPFPAAVEDAFAALQWIGQNAADLGGDPRRIAVGGDSAGGNLSAVVALLARDEGGPALCYQLLVYPAVDARASDDYRSRVVNAEGPFLTTAAMENFTGNYLGSGADEASREDFRMSPLLAQSHRGLPPALVVTAEFDPLRDEGEAYARALEAAQVPVSLSRYDGMPHVFFQLSPILDAGKRLIDEASAALREAFGA